MTRASQEEQLQFLLSCVKHSVNGKVDFKGVAEDCALVSSSAASRRYGRLLRTYSIKTNDGSLTRGTSMTSKPKSSLAVAKAAEAKRRQIEGDDNLGAAGDEHDSEPIQPKLESVDTFIKPEHAVDSLIKQEYAVGSLIKPEHQTSIGIFPERSPFMSARTLNSTYLHGYGQFQPVYGFDQPHLSIRPTSFASTPSYHQPLQQSFSASSRLSSALEPSRHRQFSHTAGCLIKPEPESDLEDVEALDDIAMTGTTAHRVASDDDAPLRTLLPGSRPAKLPRQALQAELPAIKGRHEVSSRLFSSPAHTARPFNSVCEDGRPSQPGGDTRECIVILD